MNGADLAIRLARFVGAFACGYVGYTLADALLKNIDDVGHLHDHQHGAEEAIEELHARVEKLEDAKSAATEGGGSSVN